MENSPYRITSKNILFYERKIINRLFYTEMTENVLFTEDITENGLFKKYVRKMIFLLLW